MSPSDVGLVSEFIRGGIVLLSVVTGGLASAGVAAMSFRRQSSKARSWKKKGRGPTEGIVSGLRRRHEEAARAHEDAVALYRRLVVAFGSETFASEVSDNIEMRCSSR